MDVCCCDVVGAGLDLKGKPVAVFGLGDSIGYGEYFCDAMEELYSTFKATGAKMVGHWPADGYQHEDSKVLFGLMLFQACFVTSCACTSATFLPMLRCCTQCKRMDAYDAV